MPFLIDTHIWIWSVFGDKKLNRDNIALLNNAASSEIFVSVISVWEIAQLVHCGRLQFHQSPHKWIENSLAAMSMDVIPLDKDSALESYALPGDFHGDPADRMIVATARQKNLVLVTQDKAVLTYAKKGHVMTTGKTATVK